MICQICNNEQNNKQYIVREMMLGLQENFAYFLCRECGCLQITEIPDNMQKYYPNNYYSFSNNYKKESPIKRFLTKKRDLFAIEGNTGLIGKGMNYFKPASSFIRILKFTNITQKSKILDVGTGSGSRLQPLMNAGYQVTGIDPFIEEKEMTINDLKIFKKDIHNMYGQWDLIMLNHVFEHLDNPKRVLLKINELLSPNGRCLIRIPIVSSYAWEKYQTNWVQIDAPRHFFLHSTTSFELLCAQTNFQIEKIVYDSIPFQFLGSELYQRNISMKDGDFRLNKKNTLFSKAELNYFIQKTKELNENQKGDQAAFILTKK